MRGGGNGAKVDEIGKKNENRRTRKKTESWSETENASDGAKATGEVAMTGRNEQVSNYQ